MANETPRIPRTDKCFICGQTLVGRGTKDCFTHEQMKQLGFNTNDYEYPVRVIVCRGSCTDKLRELLGMKDRYTKA